MPLNIFEFFDAEVYQDVIKEYNLVKYKSKARSRFLVRFKKMMRINGINNSIPANKLLYVFRPDKILLYSDNIDLLKSSE